MPGANFSCMGLYEDGDRWLGKPVREWSAEEGIQNPEGAHQKILTEWGDPETWTEKFATFLSDPEASRVVGFVVGAWSGEDSDASVEPILEALVGAREKLPALKSLFIGDITSEENEISWIVQGDYSPVFEAFPNLEHLGIRGGQSLSLGAPRHASLKSLTIETGGLPSRVLDQIAKADFPALEHLEVWLGSDNYGWDGTAASILPFLDGEKWPHLRYLGLRDSEIADEIARLIAQEALRGGATVLKHLEVLDLSLGTLSDVGAEALAGCDALKRLRRLDIHHHYVREEALGRLEALGIEIESDGKQTEDEWNGQQHRYVAVSE